jgi:hypothetical protein
MIDSVTSFYNNLFAIEVAVFGIIAAAIFVFLQIIYNQFSYRQISLMFKNIFFISYIVLSTITLGLTAFGSWVLAFPQLDISLGDITRVSVFQEEMFAFFILVLLFVSLALFLIFTLSNINYIRPSKIALLISKKIQKDEIGDYLLKKYGIPAPDDWVVLIRQSRDSGTAALIPKTPTTIATDEKGELSEEEQLKIESERQQYESQFKADMKVYERIKKEVEHAQDPMEPLDALMLKAINQLDLGTINEIQAVLSHVSISFIQSCKYDKDIKGWSPYLGMINNYLKYLTSMLRLHLEICDRQNLDSAKIKILETSEKVAEHVAKSSEGEISVILDFWKEVADDAIGKSPDVFIKITQQYGNLADDVFNTGDVDDNYLLNEIFRQLGWLAERLIGREGIEERPLMHDSYTTAFSALFEVILSCKYKYINKYPDSYPLIYFDAVYVLFRQLVLAFIKKSGASLKEHIFDCLYVYSSFAEVAIIKGNSNGAALATMRLQECYDKLVEENLEECAKEAIGLLVRIGGIAASHKDKLEKVEFMSKPIDEKIMDIAVNSPFRDAVEAAVWESHIHLNSDWDFIVELGRRMKTNFGFMFDWKTGKSYPDDDPRRK